jgi:hypothetical protein
LEFLKFVGSEGVGMEEITEVDFLRRWGDVCFSSEWDGVELGLLRVPQFGDTSPLVTCVLLSFAH